MRTHELQANSVIDQQLPDTLSLKDTGSIVTENNCLKSNASFCISKNKSDNLQLKIQLYFN